MRTRLLCYGIGILIGVLGTTVYAQHGGFQDKYTDVHGTRCCGPGDCQAVPVSILAYDGVRVEALVLGVRVVVPAQSVHQSEDQKSYWCGPRQKMLPTPENIRCLFYAIGS